MQTKMNKSKRLRFLSAALLLAIVAAVGWAGKSGQSGFSNRTAAVASNAPRLAMPAGGAAPQAAGAPANIVQGQVTVGKPERFDVSPPLTAIAPVTPLPPKMRAEGEIPRTGTGAEDRDTAVQNYFGPLAMPATIQNFNGIGYTGFFPPDTNGDVGPNHFVQWINTSLQMWNKSGVSVFGPVAGNTIWSGFGGVCQSTNDGDPIVLYDPMADRWMLSQFALPNYPNGPFYQCVAVSQTANPTGAYYRYAYLISNTLMNDYPKFGVWPDAYYMSVNNFNPSYAGVSAVAFDRAKMLVGDPTATFQKFDLNSSSTRCCLPTSMALRCRPRVSQTSS
jgi:hypothetical protein